MDNQTLNSENAWVDERLVAMVPSRDWHPDSRRALAQFKNRRDRQEMEQSPRWMRISMAAAVLGAIGLVITLLPWRALWSGPKGNQNRISELTKVATPAPASPSPEPEQKPVEKSGPEVTPPRAIEAKAEPQYSDEARRAHIQGTVAPVQQPAPPSPEPEQKPAERVGPGATSPRAIPPTVQPNYTDEARQAHISGTVVLSVIIRADGTGKVDKVVQGLGYGLDENAVEAFEKWRFVPATKDGKPVDVHLQVTISYHLY